MVDRGPELTCEPWAPASGRIFLHCEVDRDDPALCVKELGTSPYVRV